MLNPLIVVMRRGTQRDNHGRVSQLADYRKRSTNAVAILLVVLIGTAFFFAIIGVFGLWVAILSLCLAILFAAISALKSSGEEHI
jgi:hypothetical protein